MKVTWLCNNETLKLIMLTSCWWSISFGFVFFLWSIYSHTLIIFIPCIIIIFVADGIRKGMEKMQRAFEIYPYCSMTLNHLANHFFFTGQHFLVEQLTETALSASNHGLTKSQSYYNLARSYHSKVKKKWYLCWLLTDAFKFKWYYILGYKFNFSSS